jgi:hypothetical protein
MSRDAVTQLLERWASDPGFREAMRRDPEWAVGQAGLSLSRGELAALRNVDWDVADRQLATRTDTFFDNPRARPLAARVGADQALERAEDLVDRMVHLLA